MKLLKRSALSGLVIVGLPGCALFGPPLPPAIPTDQVAEFESRPMRARAAYVTCAATYATTNGAAEGVAAEHVIDSAIYFCRTELEAYRAIAAERSKGYSRVLGLIDRADAHTQEAVEEAIKEARSAALDALIRKRAD